MVGKFTLFLPPKKKFLIYDSTRVEDFEKYIPSNKAHVLNVRWEHINISIFLKCLLKINISSFSYFKEYINCVDPKFVVSIHDVYPQFFLIEKMFCL